MRFIYVLVGKLHTYVLAIIIKMASPVIVGVHQKRLDTFMCNAFCIVLCKLMDLTRDYVNGVG